MAEKHEDDYSYTNCCHSSQVFEERHSIDSLSADPTTSFRGLFKATSGWLFFQLSADSTLAACTSTRQRVCPKGHVRSKQGAQSKAGW